MRLDGSRFAVAPEIEIANVIVVEARQELKGPRWIDEIVGLAAGNDILAHVAINVSKDVLGIATAGELARKFTKCGTYPLGFAPIVGARRADRCPRGQDDIVDCILQDFFKPIEAGSKLTLQNLAREMSCCFRR